MKQGLQFVHDASGALLAVQIPASVWQKCRSEIERHLDHPDDSGPLAKNPHNLEEFAEFMSAWTFPYQYTPEVRCPGCDAATSDWQNDAAQPFLLKGANLGGLLVFACRGCGGTVRQKYFKDHVACEFTPPSR